MTSSATLTIGQAGSGALTWGGVEWEIGFWDRASPGLYRFALRTIGDAWEQAQIDVRAGDGTGTLSIGRSPRAEGYEVQHEISGWKITRRTATFATRAVGDDDAELTALMARRISLARAG